MEIDPELKKILSNINDRLEKIEQRISIDTTTLTEKKQTETKNKKYEGLAGGIQQLIDNNFLDTPKGVPEIVSELKRETYHYPTESIRTALSRDFTKKNRILTRVSENKKYKYIIRK